MTTLKEIMELARDVGLDESEAGIVIEIFDRFYVVEVEVVGTVLVLQPASLPMTTSEDAVTGGDESDEVADPGDTYTGPTYREWEDGM